VIERGVLQLAGEDLPCIRARGAQDGPDVSLIGGIHGCEYSSIAAVTRVMRELDDGALSGTITAVPVVSLESFRQRSPFVVPQDGKNLNRSFPGTRDGTYTDALAADIYEALIAPADALLDLHGGDLVEALEPFALYDAGPVEARARELALAFGMGYVVREAGGLGGMTSGAAAAVGVPAVIAEAGGIGQLDEEAVRLLADGVLGALRVLGMLPGEPPPARSRTVGRFDWLRSAHAGFWAASVRAGEAVPAGAPLGRVLDLYGDVLEEVRAPGDGVVLFLTTSAAVGADGLLLGLGADFT
jgi:predicted deacylase